MLSINNNLFVLLDKNWEHVLLPYSLSNYSMLIYYKGGMGHVSDRGQGDEVTHQTPSSFTTNSHLRRKEYRSNSKRINYKS